MSAPNHGIPCTGPSARVLKSSFGLRAVRRLRDALNRRLDAFEGSLANRIAPDQRIAGGPFSGMLYPVRNLGTSMILPKLLGSYEEELHQEIGLILQRQYDDLVDIGCGEGYYAVGFALRLTDIRVQAFDIDPAAIRATRDLADLNGVGTQVTVAEGCSKTQLRDLTVGSRILIISDCEGAELELLHPSTLPSATSLDLLIECHESGRDTSISDELRRRFADSHDAVVITSRTRDPSRYPRLAGWSSGEKELALWESRPPEMRWLSLVHKREVASPAV